MFLDLIVCTNAPRCLCPLSFLIQRRSQSSATPRPPVSCLPPPFIANENWSESWLPSFWGLTSAAPLPSLVSPGPALGRTKSLRGLANSAGTFCQRCLFLRPPMVAPEVTFFLLNCLWGRINPQKVSVTKINEKAGTHTIPQYSNKSKTG